jgi:hypothetical protein
MSCKDCCLNIDSSTFNTDLLKKIPLHVRNIFVCSRSINENRYEEVPEKRFAICARDLWVLTFVGKNDDFACASALYTLDNLVAAGHAELLCHLFDNASYLLRRVLWKRMTEQYPHRLYLFDALFEKESLAPIEKDEVIQDLHVYRHQLFFSAGSAIPCPEEV